jgi:hypothetical protein
MTAEVPQIYRDSSLHQIFIKPTELEIALDYMHVASSLITPEQMANDPDGAGVKREANEHQASVEYLVLDRSSW